MRRSRVKVFRNRAMVYLDGKNAHGRVALVSPEDVREIWGYTWRVHSRGYAVRSKGALMHREIMRPRHRLHLVDHVNQRKLDNRRTNLRITDQTGNAFNCDRGHMVGVSWNRRAGKWWAYIDFGGQRRHLGFFVDQLAAVEKRKSAEQELYGAVKQRGPT